jgi:hypothetical protein
MESTFRGLLYLLIGAVCLHIQNYRGEIAHSFDNGWTPQSRVEV